MANRFHTFPKGVSTNVNIIPLLEFELTYDDDTVQYVNHNTSEDIPIRYICYHVTVS